MWLNNVKDEWALINTTLSINTSTGYDIPQDVMANAITPKKASTLLNFSFETGDPSLEIYLYMHFAELQPQTSDDQRQFYIYFNGEIINGPYIPSPLTAKTLYDPTPRKCKEGKCLLQLNGMGGPIPPMINAFEVYALINHSQLETNEDDGMSKYLFVLLTNPCVNMLSLIFLKFKIVSFGYQEYPIYL